MQNSPAYKRRVERTKNKHSRAVYQNGTIVIRLAKGLSIMEEQNHIESLYRTMIGKLLEEERTKILIDPFRFLLDGSEKTTITLATGKRYTFTLKPGNKLKSERTPRGWRITIAPGVRRGSLHRFLWKIIAEEEKERIKHLVTSINEESLGVGISDVRLNFATTQWGSCSPRGIIMINAALLFVPPSLLKYVIVHELAHRRRCDHSPSFWRWVELGMPRYKKAKSLIKGYRLPNL
ncbi:M48 family metallopeptidase [Candidatus Peregrinibacteria bacterium]|nr:M48 family metallopeptidase [Candidatus Peregrinibacteria bacterium]MBT4586094.1 M48 family metallopeptidase [Candidatus Peregrinibacteria bacterium]